MTFVHGPKEAVFHEDKPAKLRFFMGYADEFERGDGSDQVVLSAVSRLLKRGQDCNAHLQLSAGPRSPQVVFILPGRLSCEDGSTHEVPCFVRFLPRFEGCSRGEAG